MPNSDYLNTINWLFEQFPSYQLIGSKAYKPTLDNINSLCEQLGHPEKNLRFIHIAGTNGKGSCSAMTASILTESGEKVGLFTSPHILDFRERIRVNGNMISERKVIDFVAQIKTLDLSFEPSFFEITFAMALTHFSEENCSICVIETGLGGRLDATNVITPLISLITNISLEHTNILGNSIAEIAFEKAGIIKQNVPIVIGETTKESKEVFIKASFNKQAQVIFVEDQKNEHNFVLPLRGSYQVKNFHSVLVVLNELQKNHSIHVDSFIQRGLDNLSKNTGFFGRMQIMQQNPLVIFDVSHNLEGIAATLASIQQMNNGKLFILYGSSADKDIVSILQLFSVDAELHFTRFKNQRSLSVEQLSELARACPQKAIIHPYADQALLEIKDRAADQDTILVFGSFFLLSDLMA